MMQFNVGQIPHILKKVLKSFSPKEQLELTMMALSHQDYILFCTICIRI